MRVGNKVRFLLSVGMAPPTHPTPGDEGVGLPGAATTPWAHQERLLLSEVVRLVGRSLSPEAVVREMLHLMSELVGLNRGRLVLLDGYERSAEGAIEAQSKARIRFAYGLMQIGRAHV